MDIKKTGHTCETSPEACAQPYLLPHTTLALFWMGRGAAILSSAQMTAEDLVFAVRGLGEAQAAYLQKLIEVCGACDALCECRAARVEETDALRRLPPKLLRELWEKGVCIRNLGRALASGAFLYDARNIRKRGITMQRLGASCSSANRISLRKRFMYRAIVFTGTRPTTMRIRTRTFT